MLTNEQLQQIADCPKMFLNRGRDIEKVIRTTARKVKHINDICMSVTPTWSNEVVDRTRANKTEALYVEMLSLENENFENAERLSKIRAEISDAIYSLSDNIIHKSLLDMRYLSDTKISDIAVEFKYSERWTKQLHADALKEIQKKAEDLLKKAL